MPVDRRQPDATHERTEHELDQLHPVADDRRHVAVGSGRGAEESRGAGHPIRQLAPGPHPEAVVEGHLVAGDRFQEVHPVESGRLAG